MTKKSGQKRIKLKPRDPFDLIRLLARSQSDPRKALAELVQNSLDAGARRVEITWYNEKGQRALRVWDDGQGIFPELGREEALRRIAHTIGYSHKRSLSPLERRQQMVLGKYGIGLIGFWSVAHVMEIRSRVAGAPACCLRMVEEQSDAEVYAARARRVEEEPTYTQITLRGMHEAALRQVRPVRLHAFLASELRGQLLERGTEVRIHDRVARGRARKHFLVKPEPFLGTPLPEFDVLQVPGREDARLELYLVPPGEERSGRVSLACGGTTVLEDLSEAGTPDVPRTPWCSGRLEGVIDFPDLAVAPSTRRGFAPDEAARAFLGALQGLEPKLEQRLAQEDRQREEQRHRELARDIQRAFRPLARRLPEYDLLEVRAASHGSDSKTGPPGAPLTWPDPPGAQAQAAPAESEEPEQADGELLYPPGPLAAVRMRPARLRLAPTTRRHVSARPLDADGRRAGGHVGFAWRLVGPGQLVQDARAPERATYLAPDQEGRAQVLVVASQGGRTCEAGATVSVEESAPGAGRAGGVPEPVAVNAPGERWRSRLVEERWEFNEGHPDYLAVAGIEAKRLRYLIHLFAKELVLRNFAGAGDAELLERMVQVVTHLDAARPGPGGGARQSDSRGR